MRLTATNRNSSERPMHRFRSTYLNIFEFLMLLSSAEVALAQASLTQIVAAKLPKQYLVSTNQLLTPEKALRATARAHDDLQHGRLAAAQREIARALDIAPHCAVALDVQGGIYVQNGDYQRSADSFQQAIDADPTLGSAYLGMAESLMAQNRYKDAQIPLDRAEALLPSAWLVHYEAALAHIHLGEIQAAFRQTALADQFTGNDPYKRSGASYLRAMVYLKLRDSGNAKVYLKETVALEPNGYYSMLAKKGLEQLNFP